MTRWERCEAWPAPAKLHTLIYALGATESELLALTRSLEQPPAPVGIDDLDAANHRLYAVYNVPPSLAALEAQALGEMYRLSAPAKQFPRAASLLRLWCIYYAYRLAGGGRITEARLYLNRSAALPSGDMPSEPYNYLQCVTYLQAGATSVPMRLRRAAQILLPQQKEALQTLQDNAASPGGRFLYLLHGARLLQEMALSLSWMGRDEEAITLSDESLMLARQIGEEEAMSLYYERGDVLRRAGRLDLILDEFPRYLGVRPIADSHLHLNLGRAHDGVGDKEGAERHFTLAGAFAVKFHRERILSAANQHLQKLPL